MDLNAPRTQTVSIHAPAVRIMTAVVESPQTGNERHEVMSRRGERWEVTFTAHPGDRYWLVADGIGPLVDPSADTVVMTERGPVGVVRASSWPSAPALERQPVDPVIYELHVRGFAETFKGVGERMPYLRDLGVDVIELMPVYPFDNTDNYWGYMPIVWGAVHQPFADGEDAAAELASLCRTAHDHGIAVWLDVVVNHTGEGEASKPTWSLRGFDDRHSYRHHADGTYTDDSGCGNDIDPSAAEIRRLVLESLQRFADLGVDGFRFDLASLLTRDGGALVRAIGDWAATAGRMLVAEPWDLASYQVGHAFPDARWLQWNDRFRDDVRGFLRGEASLVPAMIERVTGSRDLFGERPWRTVNFLTAHDGLTLHDLTAVTNDRHRSWDCGPELRPQQLANAFALLLLSAGSAMFVMGDEAGRTQHGHDNPYDVDSELTWFDWERAAEWAGLHDTVRRLIELRRRADFTDVECFGAAGAPDTSPESRSLGWRAGDVTVLANMWWERVEFDLRPVLAPGECWQVALCTAGDAEFRDGSCRVPPRTMVVLERRGEEHS
ncbi:MAG: alpha-amylase family glycosyl hydrolase [Ilumatobacteraceae bacterium]